MREPLRTSRPHLTCLRAIPVAVLMIGALVTGSRGAPAGVLAQANPAGSDWAASAASFRGQDGTQLEFVCPAGGQPGSVWGTSVYTDDSSVCGAATQVGKITIATGGIVTIQISAGLDSYTGSTQNGVTSDAYGSWSGSFTVLSARRGGGASGVAMGGGDWNASASTYEGNAGGRYSYLCPAGGTPVPSRVWGTNVYTDDSSVCTAAVHVGLIAVAGGGTVTIEMRPGQSSYRGSASHGITTQAYPSFTGSFRFPAAALIPGGSGGGGSTTTTTSSPSATPPATGTATGTVTVNGKPFTSGRIPYRAKVDVTNGNLLLVTDTGKVHVFGSGVPARFQLLRGTDNHKPIVELKLIGGDFSVCKRTKSSASTSDAATTVRQLWGNGKGRFRTNGRYSSATVRGTFWLTADRCDGTFTSVKRGVVQVLDRRLRRQVTVRAGKSYLARP